MTNETALNQISAVLRSLGWQVAAIAIQPDQLTITTTHASYPEPKTTPPTTTPHEAA